MNNLLIVFDKGYLETILDFLYSKKYSPIQILHSINVIVVQANKEAIDTISNLDGVISVELERTIQL